MIPYFNLTVNLVWLLVPLIIILTRTHQSCHSIERLALRSILLGSGSARGVTVRVGFASPGVGVLIACRYRSHDPFFLSARIEKL